MNQKQATWWLLGLPIDCLTMEQAKDRIVEAARTRTRLIFATPNVNFLALSRRNSAFRDAILNTDLSLADGMPLVWIARMLGIPLPERVAGSNLIESLLGDARTPALRVFFLGGAPGVAEAACSRLNQVRGGLRAVGWHDPGFVDVGKMSGAEVIEKINSSGADLLIVALGAEKGHLWIEYNRSRLTTPVISHLGAVVNFIAGTVKRAPKSIQDLGLEWAWRIREEPALARRYARDFVFLAKEFLTAVVPLIFSQRWSSLRKSQLKIDINKTMARRIVIELRGNLSVFTSQELNRQLSSISLDADELVIDARGLETIDSFAIGYLYRVKYRRDRSTQHSSYGLDFPDHPKMNRIIGRHRAYFFRNC